ncbi:MAG TPA: mechanosensitive ion channel domain-containing protein [Xanthomonadaceae bacterium]|nr:mechanosensitive ion channel domain-containing protein [Xanthomonadaceae bacterium]
MPDFDIDWSHVFVVAALLGLTWLAIAAIGAAQRRVLRKYPVDIEDNLQARRVQTQARVLGRLAQFAVGLVGISLALMTFPAVRQLGTTLLASAGIIGLVAGIAAKPVFGNLIAGLQLALSQPIRLDDVVIIENEWGRVEEITSTYVIVRIWDERRLVVPLQWFIEHPFQNWTRTTAQLLGDATLWLDYRTPMGAVRDQLKKLCEADPRWDGRVCVAQVTDADRHAIQVRLLVSARNSGDLFDLRCAVRECMLAFLEREHPAALPRLRADLARDPAAHEGARGEPTAGGATPVDTTADAASTSSPGAEDVNDADLAVLAQRPAGAEGPPPAA